MSNNYSGEASNVAVVGAGIGGIAAAVALQRAGFTVDVFDQAREFGEVGGTITIDSYTTGILGEWGLADALRPLVASCDGLEMRTITGELTNYAKIPDLTDLGVDVAGRTGTRELFGIQRSDLHRLLLSQVSARNLHPGKRLGVIEDIGDSVQARFEDGTTIRSEVLIGADGIRSTVRRLFTDVEAVPAGVTICRSLAASEILPDGWLNDRMRRWEYVRSDASSVNTLFAPTRGGSQVGIDTSLYGGDQLLDLESNIVPIERLLALYPEDTDPVIIGALRAGLVETRAYPLYDLPPIDTWAGPRVALLGDAAHAMRPLLGQGANQAIQDAEELARCMQREHSVARALSAYERVRGPFTRSIQDAARTFRPRYNEILKGSSGRTAV